MADIHSSGQFGNEGRAEGTPDDLAAQISTLRADLSKLTESVGAIGGGAKRAVSAEAEELTERLRDKVRSEPIMALAVTAGIAYLFGLMHRN